jgi:hypothetical protein
MIYRGPVVLKVVPVEMRSTPVSVNALEFSFVVSVPEPGSAEELEGHELLVRHLPFHFDEMVWRPAVNVILKHAVHRLHGEELKLRVVPAEGQLGHLTLVVTELMERLKPRPA